MSESCSPACQCGVLTSGEEAGQNAAHLLRSSLRTDTDLEGVWIRGTSGGPPLHAQTWPPDMWSFWAQTSRTQGLLLQWRADADTHLCAATVA